MRGRAADPKAVRRVADLAFKEMLKQVFEDGRIHGDPKPAVVWPQLTLDECEAQTRVLLVEWIRTLHEEDLSRRVDYTNVTNFAPIAASAASSHHCGP